MNSRLQKILRVRTLFFVIVICAVSICFALFVVEAYVFESCYSTVDSLEMTAVSMADEAVSIGLGVADVAREQLSTLNRKLRLILEKPSPGGIFRFILRERLLLLKTHFEGEFQASYQSLYKFLAE